MIQTGKSATRAKTKYNDKMYDRFTLRLPKELASLFRAKCEQDGISHSQVFRDAAERFIEQKPEE